MPTCDTCGNDYDKAFQITTHDGQQFMFDSFECAVHKVAPTCSHCGCKILGHGVEADGVVFCCAACARHTGVEGARDRADAG
jgi:hypothetical protein